MNNRVERFLDEHNAKCLRVIRDESDSVVFRVYLINGTVVILQLFVNDAGFQFYIPATNKNSIDEELEAVEKAIQ